MWIFNKTMAVRRTFESVLSFYDEDYYYCCFKAAALAAARMYAIFTISWLLSWISYCVQPKSRQWEFFLISFIQKYLCIYCVLSYTFILRFFFPSKQETTTTKRIKWNYWKYCLKALSVLLFIFDFNWKAL